MRCNRLKYNYSHLAYHPPVVSLLTVSAAQRDCYEDSAVYPKTLIHLELFLRLKFISKPPIRPGLITVAAMLLPEWSKRLVDKNSKSSKTKTSWADYVPERHVDPERIHEASPNAGNLGSGG
jgi:hypothetical protein